MSELLLRAASEPKFRKLLLSEPAKALAGYDLSSETKSVIKNMITDFK